MTKPSHAGETRAKCTLCNEINAATNNVGHEVTNIMPKPSHAGKLEQMHFMQ